LRAATRPIDSFRYLNPASARIVKTMIAMASRDPVPWTPLPRPLGQPNDAATQRAVLHATLDALRDAAMPGTVVHLPFEGPESPAEVHWHPKEPSPIIQLLARAPSLFQRLAAGDIPPEASRRNRERNPS